METYLIVISEFLLILFLAFVATGMALLWRTSIYTRGGILRPIGRMLDAWVMAGIGPMASWSEKVKRFFAYPLGYCIYCSSFHIGCLVFFILNNQLTMELNGWWFIPFTGSTHIMIIGAMELFIHGNKDMRKADWGRVNLTHFIDTPTTYNRRDSILNEQEEIDLTLAKGVTYDNKG